ncbi:MAG: sugar ABC transporter substrate-binding protein, partial [Lachnospiraceae bacterium]|nr:sugar ABC transporter substrate-binding protein [Lachnospiraceae bacterium]
MKMKKTAALILAGAMALSLSACGGNAQGDSQGSAQGGSAGGAVKVAIWDNAQLAGLKEIMGDFTAESGIDVEIQVVP